MKKIAIITTHPIQYNAPLFAFLSKEKEMEFCVFYTWGKESIGSIYDHDFGINIEWDIPLLDGYNYVFASNTSSNRGSHHFKGIVNPELIQEIENWEPNVIWVWGWAFESHLKALRHFKRKIPIWFRGDSTLLDEFKGISIKKFARRIFLTWVYRHVDKAFYVGTHNKMYFKKFGLKENQLVYAPHSIDNDQFADVNGEKSVRASQWREELGFLTTDFVLMFAGKFEKKKNPSFLIDLSKQIEMPNVKFLMVGNGFLEDELKFETQNDSRFIFLDFQNQSQMPILYRVADLFILPSLGPGETWGMSINEALASGTKVLASVFCGGAVDLISDKNGLLFNPKTQLDDVIQYIDSYQCEAEPWNLKTSLISNHSYYEILRAVRNEINS